MPRATVSSERRKEKRKRPLGLIYVELSSSNGGMMRDLSEKGFAMRAMIPLRRGEITPFAFSLDPSTRLEGTCKVLWVEENGRVAGLQFTEVTTDLRAQVRAWLAGQADHAEEPGPLPAPASIPSPVSKSEKPKLDTMQQLREELRSVPARPEIPEIEAKVAAPLESEMQEAPRLPQASIPVPPTVVEAPPVSATAPVLVTPMVTVPEPAPPEISAEAVKTHVPIGMRVPVLQPLPTLPDVEFPSEFHNRRRRSERSVVSVAARILLLLALVGAAIVFRREVGNGIVWLGLEIGGTPSPEILPAQSEPSVPAPASSSDSDSPATPTPTETGHKNASAVPTKNEAESTGTAESTFTVPAKNPSPASPAAVLPVTRSTAPGPSSTPGVEPGQLEFLAAQDILQKNTDTGLPEAVRLLWIAVEKGNPNAEVALAELFREGRGVSRNCDQTKILLTAAARKGSSQAQRLLKLFEGDSCE